MIETFGLSKRFANETAIEYRDLVFGTGRSYMLMGASGCGKSTLLNMIAGILTPDTGRVVIDGTETSSLPQKEKDRFRIDRIGFIFQDFKLIENMTVRDNIDILRLEGIDTSGAGALLDELGLGRAAGKKVRQLSGGEKQRVAIVRALVKRPDIILADEPTGNLNFAIGEKVVEELLRVSRGKTLIAVSHDDRLAPFFDEVIDMNGVTGGRRSAPAQEARDD
jgi:putative ABC transport system ATP-binding protein